MPSLKISLVSSQLYNESDDKLNNVFDGLLTFLRNENPKLDFTKIDFFKFSYNDEPYILSRNSIASLTPSKYISCKENIPDKITPILAVKKVYQKLPYFSAFFIANLYSEINSINSDKIKRIFLVSAGSTSGYIAPIYKLWESGIIRMPNETGIREKGWEIILVGNQRDVEEEIMMDKEAIGATGQFSYQDDPEKCIVKPILQYYNLPQDVIIISNNLLPFQSIIINWFENIFKIDSTGNYIHKEAKIISDSSAKITGVYRIDTAFKNALDDLQLMKNRVNNVSENAILTVGDATQFEKNSEEQPNQLSKNVFSEIKTYNLFLASSEELKDDRQNFEIFISRENNNLIKKGVYLELIVWENFIDIISKEGLQKEYNKIIKECDIFVSLFFTKVGKYTEEEFETAFRNFQSTNKPIIFTYFKDAPISVENINKDIKSLLKFRKKLENLGHYRTIYKNIEDLQYQFKSQLEKLKL